MARQTGVQFDRLELDNIIDGEGNYTPVETSPANKFSIRFPPNDLYGYGTTEDVKMTVTLKIEERG